MIVRERNEAIAHLRNAVGYVWHHGEVARLSAVKWLAAYDADHDDDDDESPSCSFCRVEGKSLTHYDIGVGADLCELCASTPGGNYATHPAAYSNTDSSVLRTLILLTWRVLDAIGKDAGA